MELLKRTVFACAVLVYLITAVGVPVYLHYCGGELETISYVTKTDSCCDGEESENADNGCCKDEGYILKSYIDCTTKDSSPKLVKDLFPVLSIFFNFNLVEKNEDVQKVVAEQEHQPRSQDVIVSITVLRI